MIMVEGNLEFDFSRTVSATRFDNPSCHGLSHCMKAVDFILELPDRLYFVEIKDPQHPSARIKNIQDFLNEFRSDVLRNALVSKHRDSYLYQLAMGKITKPAYYLVLVALDTLTAAESTVQSDSLRKHLPVNGPLNCPWPRPFVIDCFVFNLKEWNSTMKEFPAKRQSYR